MYFFLLLSTNQKFAPLSNSTELGLQTKLTLLKCSKVLVEQIETCEVGYRSLFPLAHICTANRCR